MKLKQFWKEKELGKWRLTFASGRFLERIMASCLPVARMAVTIDRPNVGELPPATATRTIVVPRFWEALKTTGVFQGEVVARKRINLYLALCF